MKRTKLNERYKECFLLFVAGWSVMFIMGTTF